jgi:hypothetical protein
MRDVLVLAGLGVGPVALLLAALTALDSYKLVRPRSVLALTGAGAVVALFCLVLNRFLIQATGLDLAAYAQWISPVVEETAKGLVVLWLARTHRIAFLVDAAIYGFAVGTGFAVVENLDYARLHPGAGLGIWLVRGGGTALMHGGVTAIVGMVAVGWSRGRSPSRSWLVGVAIAVAVHGVYNRFYLSPLVSTGGILLVLPALIGIVFRRGERAVAGWLNLGFDADTEMLELILSGRVSGSPVGEYLESLRHRFRGEVVADLLNWLRIHLELSLAAKGLLMMREAGFAAEPDADTREKLAELAYLDRSIGPTGRLAMAPILGEGKQAWQKQLLAR